MEKKIKLGVILVCLMFFGCKKKEALKPQPVNYTAEFDMLAPNSGFKTLWNFQTDNTSPQFLWSSYIKDYTLNSSTGKMHLVLSTADLSGRTINPRRMTIDLTNNTELIEKEGAYQGPYYEIGIGQTIVQYQPFVNNLFWWGPESSSGKLYNNDIETWYNTGYFGELYYPRIDRNGKLIRHTIRTVPDFPPGKWSGYTGISSDKTSLFDKKGDEENFVYAYIESINDTSDYYFAVVGNTPTNAISEVRLYKSNMRSDGIKYIGQSKNLSSAAINVPNPQSKQLAYKLHYTANPDIITVGILVNDANSLVTKFYSFIWNKQTETITKVVDNIAASTNVYAKFDLDDLGNIYYAHINAIYKATTSGAQQIGITNFCKTTNANSFIDNIKVFNNKPYIVLKYTNYDAYNYSTNYFRNQVGIVVPE